MPIEYDNVEIEIGRSVSGEWEVRLLDSPINRPREPFVFEEALPDLRRRVAALQEVVVTGGAAEERRRLSVDIGKRLYEMLLPGKVGLTFEQSLALLEKERERAKRGLRIRLSFGGNKDYHPELVNLPWELLCRPIEEESFIADQPHTPLVRYLDLSRQEKPLKAKPPLKVLAILASPEHPRCNPVDIDRHREILLEAARESKWLELHFAEPTIDGMCEELDLHEHDDAPFHALHFLGHGLFHEGKGMLCFEKADKSLDLVSGSDLARHLAQFADLRLVVLATCEGAKMMEAEGHNPFHGVASALVASRMPAVVGMQFSVSEAAVGDFTSKFYTTLGNNRCVDVDEAMAQGRRKILRSRSGSLEWATPVLFLRSPDGHLLDLDEAGPPPAKKIAVFNIKDHGWPSLRPAYKVDLTRHFDKKGHRAYIKSRAHWQKVLDDLRLTFNSRRLSTEVGYHLLLAAPISVAYAAGNLLDAGSGHAFDEIHQRGLRGTQTWNLDDPPSARAAKWIFEHRGTDGEDRSVEETATIPEGFPLDSESREVAVAVSLSRSVLPALDYYLKLDARDQDDPPRVGHLIHATVPEPGLTSVENGGHALALARDLVRKLDEELNKLGRPRVHLFLAVPNSFAYLMGRYSKVLAGVQLYEFDITGQETKTYSPSIFLR